MTEDNKSETGHEAQETGQTVPYQQPSPKDTDSGSPHSQNEPFFHVDSPVSNEPTRTQVAREAKETYNNYRKNRKTKGHTWWGSKHYEPERGDPDREFMFARNMPVSNQEIEDAQQAYDSIIIDPDTGKPNPLGPHLRPTTPPMERVEKQVKGLMDQGVDRTEGCPCRLEMATQQCDVTEELEQAIRDCEEKEVRCQQLQSENAKLEMEVQRLKGEIEKLQQEKREKGDIQNEPSGN
ncbi:uncharacterized protein BKA55DRAFT_592996 [Fusarium redolens]|uniref:Uncharacterized protein n=1 Tax=Fusarium redolens TaxID=48865 RepID=A0A9P9HDX9_FUSRE|nr:uncharacterized protein BKA55DRAFT_592996 [Fusarium redolens]KAH7255768.1 hypothetical protein BKA55DRAFT_592996 [Fusarium redolens]